MKLDAMLAVPPERAAALAAELEAPSHTVEYLRGVALPSLGSERPELTLVGSVFVCVPGTEDAVRRRHDGLLGQVGVYGLSRQAPLEEAGRIACAFRV